MKLFHGSKATFDTFSIEYPGSGEQAISGQCGLRTFMEKLRKTVLKTTSKFRYCGRPVLMQYMIMREVTEMITCMEQLPSCLLQRNYAYWLFMRYSLIDGES
ncbi:Uncharacterised protein [Serratia quinivorans]|nr:Uncharacterised protein [Serratia quinivorans]CAI1942266.1 Uncharacterised protein [Serratia quinivorans]CAI1965060.1 Uncharacterised protein [Serratia quinivorans]